MARTSAFYAPAARRSSSSRQPAAAKPAGEATARPLPLFALAIHGLTGVLLIAFTGSPTIGAVGLLSSLLWIRATTATQPSEASHSVTSATPTKRPSLLGKVFTPAPQPLPSWDRSARASTPTAELVGVSTRDASTSCSTIPATSTARRRLCASVAVSMDSDDNDDLAALKAAFEEVLDGAVGVTGVPAEPEVATREGGPCWGAQHAFEGASTRMRALRMLCANDADGGGPRGAVRYDYLVAIESGVLPIVTREATLGHEVACVLVREEASERTAHAFSQSRPWPLAQVQAAERAGYGGASTARDVAELCRRHHERSPRLAAARPEQLGMCMRVALAELCARAAEEGQGRAPPG